MYTAVVNITGNMWKIYASDIMQHTLHAYLLTTHNFQTWESNTTRPYIVTLPISYMQSTSHQMPG